MLLQYVGCNLSTEHVAVFCMRVNVRSRHAVQKAIAYLDGKCRYLYVSYFLLNNL